MKRFALLGLLVFSTALAQAPRPAQDMVAEAQAKAVKGGKKTMVIFHASWCGWCKRLDAFMDQPQFKQIFAKNYEIVHLTVLESPDKKALENKGSDAVLKSVGGEGQGLPFMAVLGADGKTLINSRRPSEKDPNGENIGHPMVAEEVAHFMTMLRKTSKINSQDLGKIETWLKAQKR